MARAAQDSDQWEELAGKADYRPIALAALCHISARHFRRRFQASEGVSPQVWLDELRLQKAMEILPSAETIKKVWRSLGFKQASHFTRKFKAKTGLTPSQFVALKKSQNHPVVRSAEYQI